MHSTFERARYRAYNCIYEQMVDVTAIQWGDGQLRISTEEIEGERVNPGANPSLIVMQTTTRLDGRRQLIYEGDVLRFETAKRDRHVFGVVFWSERGEWKVWFPDPTFHLISNDMFNMAPLHAAQRDQHVVVGDLYTAPASLDLAEVPTNIWPQSAKRVPETPMLTKEGD